MKQVGTALAVADLGVVPYGDALALQRELADDRIAGRLALDTLLLLEHPPVVTLGRGTTPSSLPIEPARLHERGIEVFEIERGGDVTYHGPGQLVGYPIFDLSLHRRDLHWFLRQLEAALISALADCGIEAERRPGFTGVWTHGRKIASIGIHVRQWVTWHGFALNVTTDLSAFDLIVPCGIEGVTMTSVAQERAGGRRGGGAQGRRRPDRPGPTAGGAEAAPGQDDLGIQVRDAVSRAVLRTFDFESIEPAAGKLLREASPRVGGR